MVEVFQLVAKANLLLRAQKDRRKAKAKPARAGGKVDLVCPHHAIAVCNDLFEDSLRAWRRNKLGGDDMRGSAIRWKPDAVIGSNITRGLSSAVHLRVLRAIRHTQNPDPQRMVGGRNTSLHLRLGRRGDDIRSRHPEHTMLVLQDLIETVGRQSLPRGELLDNVATNTKETVVACRKPHRSFSVFQDRPDLLLTQSAGRNVLLKAAVPPKAKPALRPDPYLPHSVFH